MLDQILSSAPKTSLAAFLALAPHRAFTAQELSRRLHMSETKLASLLREFTKLGLVKSFSRGKRFYLVNDKHPFLDQLRVSLRKQGRRYDDELFTSIRRLGQIKAAFLSGLFTGQPQLPVDILLVGKVNLPKLDRFLATCRRVLGQEINYSIMSPEEFQSRRDTFDRFIKDIFDYPHLIVVDTLSATTTPKPRKTTGATKSKFNITHF